AQHLRGHHAHPALVDAPRGHAFVTGLDHHAHAAGPEHVLDHLGDLRGHLLLDLEAPRIGLDHARELADAHHLAIGQVADVSTADDRRHVVFAVAFELDVAQHDHLVVAADLLEGALEVLARVLAIAAEPVAVGIDHALGRVEQAFARGIIAGPAQQGADGGLGLVAVHAVALFVRIGHGLGSSSPRNRNVTAAQQTGAGRHAGRLSRDEWP